MNRILGEPAVARYETALGRDNVKRAAKHVLDRIRGEFGSVNYDAIIATLLIDLEELRAQELAPVINATGIILHTNLGRSPLALEAVAAIERVANGYCNLEYDLQTGRRGSRSAGTAALLRELTGCDDALIVNNCAAAVLLVLDTFAKGREVIVARSQLVEIGGGFRIPEVLDRSGATLVEVGTTNRVRIADFEHALSPKTALLLRTHQSNYRLEGFTEDVTGHELAQLGRRAGVPVVEDLGTGALVELGAYGVQHERTVQDVLADNIGLVTFSGDKLLGGSQAGIVVGRSNLVARLRNNSLLRALRVDKLTLAALRATLELHRTPSLLGRIPIYAMLSARVGQLRRRAEAYLSAVVGAKAVESNAYIGGGTLPQSRVPSVAVAVATEHPQDLATQLRMGTPAIVARIERDSVLLDLRTIAPGDDETAIRALRTCIRHPQRQA